MGTLHEEQCTFSNISRSFLLRLKNILTKVVGKLETHISCSVTLLLLLLLFIYLFFFFFENRAVYEIMWENVVERVSPHGACAFHAG